MSYFLCSKLCYSISAQLCLFLCHSDFILVIQTSSNNCSRFFWPYLYLSLYGLCLIIIVQPKHKLMDRGLTMYSKQLDTFISYSDHCNINHFLAFYALKFSLHPFDWGCRSVSNKEQLRHAKQMILISDFMLVQQWGRSQRIFCNSACIHGGNIHLVLASPLIVTCLSFPEHLTLNCLHDIMLIKCQLYENANPLNYAASLGTFKLIESSTLWPSEQIYCCCATIWGLLIILHVRVLIFLYRIEILNSMQRVVYLYSKITKG